MGVWLRTMEGERNLSTEEPEMSNQPSESAQNGRKRLFSFLMVLFVLTLGIAIGTVISYHVNATGPGDSQLQMQSDGKPVAGGAFLALSQAFEEVSNRIEPCVVNINTEEIVTPGQDQENPMGDLRRFFGTPFQMEPQMRRSLGSGVIVDPKGYIVTNNHVVEDATRIKVTLSGGDEYTAKVIGTDPVSDIAVIKINGKNDLPYARIGNSKNMKVGDWVIAIGSPFGLDQTVTAGIISTTGRTFEHGEGPSDFSYMNDYLQTDAAINRGNSGGPLVNMNAEVVGINSFISTSSGSSAGVGFAVPSHLFTRVYNQILQNGKVSRGWVGVSMNQFPFTPAMASYFGVKQGSGVLITQLADQGGNSSEAGPAAKAGLKPEDVVTEFDGKKVRNNQDFRMAVADTPPGKKVKVKVIRHGQEKDFDLVVAESKVFDSQGKKKTALDDIPEKPKTEIGLEIDNVPSRIAKELEINGGAYVLTVKPGSLADDAGLIAEADIIVAANGKPINNKEELSSFVKGLKSGEPVILKFFRVARSETNRLESQVCYTSIVRP
jgi:serine protease Do